MGLKELLDKIQRQIPADAEQTLRDSVADAITEASVITDSLGAKNRENEKRRNENTELQSKIEAHTAEIARLKAANDSDETKALRAKADKYDALMKEQASAAISKWKEADAKLAAITTADKRHDAVTNLRSKLRKAEEGKELDHEAAKYNLELFDVFVGAGGLNEPGAANRYSPSGGKDQPDSTPMTSGDAAWELMENNK